MSNDPECLATLRGRVYNDAATCTRAITQYDILIVDLKNAERLQAAGSESRESIADHLERLEVARSHAYNERARLVARDGHRA